MKKYIVKVTSFFATFVEVEAENESEARTKAETHMKESDKELEHHYEGTLPLEEWAVVDEETLKILQEKEAAQKNQEDNKL